ncbi:MAG: 3-phosphoserine/phosphohydroxythreonine transaminase [Bacteroidetes bacterium]|nr:3-phosphoserine/phosphohydroxythreonine transaminase [Bacteroidota bacterium]
MVLTKKIHNFSAGPAILPQEVLKEAAEGILDFTKGLSILEISHRSKEFEAVLEEAKSLVKELLGVPDGYSILFLHGGARLQFVMAPLNQLTVNGYAAYVNTGTWATGAIKEAKIIGKVNVIASSEDKKFTYIPKGFTIPADADYLHLTSNNTVYGTQYRQLLESPVPVICDMSSDIMSRKINVSKFALIYAGAQKNMGPAGTTLVIIKNDFIKDPGRTVPTMMSYKIHVENNSLYNTPSVYAIFVCMLTMRWLKKVGGVEYIEKKNREKADYLYAEVDRNPLFRGVTVKEDRSVMNATFVLSKPELETTFNQMASEAGLSGIKGHRSVGGYRASLYNALPFESVKALVEVMQEFERKKG